MIIDVKIDVDWIREDGGIDEAIRDAIVSGVINTVKKDVAVQIDAKVADEITRRVSELTDNLWADFMEKRVTVTDKYGDPVESHDTIKDMLKAKLDHFLNERVNERGEVYPQNQKGCPYGAKARLEWLLDSRIAAHTKDFVTGVQRDFDTRLKSALNDKLKESLSASMMKNIDLGQVIKNP